MSLFEIDGLFVKMIDIEKKEDDIQEKLLEIEHILYFQSWSVCVIAYKISPMYTFQAKVLVSPAIFKQHS